MNELRWILLIVGVLILIGIYYFGDPNRRSRPKPEPDKDGSGASGPHFAGEDPPDEAMERELERLGALISEERQGQPLPDGSAPLDPEPEKIVALFLKPGDDRRVPGGEVLAAAEKVGLSYGDRQIFHRLQEIGEETVAIYSLADMMSPGSFDLDTLSTTSTSGLCLFLTLPNPLSALDAWDAMLATGQRLADLLDVDLLDESHSSLSRQRLAHIREEMREYDRRSEFSLPQ